MVEILDTPFLFDTAFPKQLPGEAARVLQLHTQLESFELLDPEQQNALLSAQLEHLLGHAKRFSPYWTERLDSWKSQEAPLRATLNSLPMLPRSDLQSRFEEITTHFPQRERMRPARLSTSGSTGTPVCVEHLTDIHNPLQYAAMLLTGRWHKIDPRKPVGTLRPTVKDDDRVPLGIPFRWYGPVALGFSRCTKDRRSAELYEYCRLMKPTYLFANTTSIFGLARHAIQDGCRDFRPEIALNLGSVVTDEIRETVREGLGTKIVDRYSSEETGIIAIQCPKHDHLHVLSPLTLVEIVDEQGRPCSVGQPGRILVTDMQSYGTPLIRYDIGDIGEWGEPCDCGITLPVIKKLWGRSLHMITRPDGRSTFATIYAHDFEDLRDVEEYRFVLHQNAIVAAQLRVKKQSPALARSVTEGVQRALGYPYPVKIQYVDKIDWGLSWKEESFSVSDSPPPDGA